tara:strand:- start:22950 stop:23384 length:435 start_codon:yes stop_codon:yes gene_type:complete
MVIKIINNKLMQGRKMKKTILEIYALAVCFFAVGCFIVTLGMAIWDMVEIAAPEFTISNSNYQCHQSDSEYQQCFASNRQYIRDKSPEIFPQGQELTDERLVAYERILKQERRQGLQSFIQKLIILLINAFVFFFHWRVATKER